MNSPTAQQPDRKALTARLEARAAPLREKLRELDAMIACDHVFEPRGLHDGWSDITGHYVCVKGCGYCSLYDAAAEKP